METADMHPAVRLLLARMASNPDEFDNKASRWGPVVADVMANALPEEAETLKETIRCMKMDRLHRETMAILVRDPEDDAPKAAASGAISDAQVRQLKAELAKRQQQYESAARQQEDFMRQQFRNGLAQGMGVDMAQVAKLGDMSQMTKPSALGAKALQSAEAKVKVSEPSTSLSSLFSKFGF